MTNRLVYETRPKRAKRSNGVAMLVVAGVRWLNMAIPRDRDGNAVAHPLDGKCERCGYGYSHLMYGARQPCNECATEDLWATVAWWEGQGIPMGLTGTVTVEDSTHIVTSDALIRGRLI